MAVPWVSSRADVKAPPPAEFLEADPNVRLHVLHQVADVDVAVGVGQGVGDEDSLQYSYSEECFAKGPF